MSEKFSLPLSQIALSSIDIRRSDQFWREGLGFIGSATSRMFKGPVISNVMRVENAKTTARWLVGQDEWSQIETWQFDQPISKLMDEDYAPNYAGYSRCGVWVTDFDATIARLLALGYPTMTAPMGDEGERRVCVRDPDGIYIELYESDPLKGYLPSGPFESSAALRSVTMTTTDFDATCQFVEQGLGLPVSPVELHQDDHEALWGLKDAKCVRKDYFSGKMIVEVVHYTSPATVPKTIHNRLIDQGILNVAYSDSETVKGIRLMEDQTIKAGAMPTERMVTPLGGCVYVTDQQGFSHEFSWAHRFIAQRVAGYFPMNKKGFIAADNKRIETRVDINAEPKAIWPLLTTPDGLNQWSDFGTAEFLVAGQKERFGRGHERKITIGKKDLVEQIVHVTPEKELRYRIIRRGPFVNYTGEMHLDQKAGITQVTWVSRFRSKIPFTGWLMGLILSPKYRKSLANLKAVVEQSVSAN